MGQLLGDGIFTLVTLVGIVWLARILGKGLKEYADAERVHEEKCGKCEHRQLVLVAVKHMMTHQKTE